MRKGDKVRGPLKIKLILRIGVYLTFNKTVQESITGVYTVKQKCLKIANTF